MGSFAEQLMNGVSRMVILRSRSEGRVRLAITPGTVAVVAGTLSAGFEYPNAKFTLITHGRMSAGSQPKAKKKDKNSKAVYSLAELTPGDYVVHATHGIGIFEGIHKIDMQGITKDYIKLRYAKNDTLYVPVTQLDLVAKYIGPREDSGVKLHRLGGTSPAGCAVCEDAIYAAQTAHDAGFYLVGIQDVSSAADAPALRRVCDQFLPDWTALDWAQV